VNDTAAPSTCPHCNGTGKMMRDAMPVTGVMPGDPLHPPPGFSIWQPWQGCGGTGIASRCEGHP